MRFTIAAAVLATSAMASEAMSTDYATQLVTVIDCPPEVTNCPAHEKTTAVITSVVPLTTSTILSTKVHTITSCAPEVTNCPAHSTVYSTETVAVSTTVCPVGEVTETPTHYANNTIVPSYTKPGPGGCNGYDCPPGQSNVPHGPSFTTKVPVGPATTEAAVCESTSVTAITKSYTTVLTTVEYSTIVAACPTGEGSPKPSGSVVPPPCNGESCPKTTESPKPTTPAGETCTGANCTTPSNPPPVTAGAASFAGSALFAAAAGVAAYVFA